MPHPRPRRPDGAHARRRSTAARRDRRPAATSRTPADTAADLNGLTVSLPAELPLLVAPAVAAALQTAAAALAEAGATVIDVPLPSPADADEAFRPIFLAEALHSHVQAGLWPDRADEYAPHVRARLERAETITALQLLDGQLARERVRAAADALFGSVGLVISPVAAVPRRRRAREASSTATSRSSCATPSSPTRRR